MGIEKQFPLSYRQKKYVYCMLDFFFFFFLTEVPGKDTGNNWSNDRLDYKKWYNNFGKQFDSFFKMLNLHLSYDTAIPFLHIYSR